jgi:N-acetylmuramoyl-L-alanine amidase
MRICIDPGHGWGNVTRHAYDPGVVIGKHAEAAVVMIWANALRDALRDLGHTVIRTRVDALDPCPVSRRDDIARSYECQRMISLHCNAADGSASGTEVFYRGADDKPMAEALSRAVSRVLRIKDRKAKTEKQSQHRSLAVMEFDQCWLIEIGFLDHPTDRSRLLDPALMRQACEQIAHIITGP